MSIIRLKYIQQRIRNNSCEFAPAASKTKHWRNKGLFLLRYRESRNQIMGIMRLNVHQYIRNESYALLTFFERQNRCKITDPLIINLLIGRKKSVE